MSTTAHHMLNRFRQISTSATAPAATSYGPDNGTDPNAPPLSAGSNVGANGARYRQDLPPAEAPKEAHMLTNQAIEDLLCGIPTHLLPPLALADGGNAFDGDASNDWFYPGRSVRNGMLPDVDLVEIEVMEITRLS